MELMNPAERHAQALESERKAWILVADKLPGAPGHDPNLWELWKATVEVADEAKRALMIPGRRSGAGAESVLQHLAHEADFKPFKGGPG
ncbi:hypothetical protein FN976_07940 [Caenimonas sedimenti]|uniref:Uncharacterized protein n=1 Tax=Caenimonas sedimenti TaxID=2596921 RepID=A0A562ZTH8_9BURK|nr:hypothetical protein [Caenimonas sedimenti]TWO71912.1 hypothetical protein FN976_07940 [Caenimonas sedimenti]